MDETTNTFMVLSVLAYKGYSQNIVHLRAEFQTRHFPNRANPCGREVKAYVCVRYVPGIAGSIPVWDMDICLF